MKNKRINFVVTADELAYIKSYCAKKHVTISKFVRDLIYNEISYVTKDCEKKINV